MTCTEVSVSSSARQPPAAIVRFVVHSALAWLYVHTMWMAKFVDWESIAFPTISHVGTFMPYMLTLWTMVSKSAGVRISMLTIIINERLPLRRSPRRAADRGRIKFFGRPLAEINRPTNLFTVLSTLYFKKRRGA